MQFNIFAVFFLILEHMTFFIFSFEFSLNVLSSCVVVQVLEIQPDRAKGDYL